MHAERTEYAAEIACRMAFDPQALAEAVQAMAEEGVMLLGYSFEPHEDRGRARFKTLNPTNAVLALEGLGLEPETLGETAERGPWPDA